MNISHALQTDDKYPYTGQCSHKCRRSLTQYTLESFDYGPDDVNLEDNLACWLETGPVAVNVHAGCEEFQVYTGGVFESTACQGQPDHIMLLVGYGTENGQDYWIVRNRSIDYTDCTRRNDTRPIGKRWGRISYCIPAHKIDCNVK